jgi:nascent polypeptide-associated complex subunit alpha
MIPGVNPRQLKQMMRQLGMSQEDIEALKVIIETPNERYVFENPSVQKVTMQGQTTFQVVGDYSKEEIEEKFEITDDDINMVVDSTGVSKEKAKEVLEKVKGDIAKAILELENN